MENKTFNIIVLSLIIIGGVNWGLIGFFNFNLVDALFAQIYWFEKIIYALVGLASLYALRFVKLFRKNTVH